MNRFLVSICLFFTCLYSNAQNDFNIIPVNDSIYVHQSTVDEIAQNGLIVLTDEGVLIVDLPHAAQDLNKLLQWTEQVLKQPVALVILSDYYLVAAESIELINDLGAVVGYPQSNAQIQELSLNLMPMSASFYTIGNYDFQLSGMTDNGYNYIWFAKDKLLYLRQGLSTQSTSSKDDIFGNSMLISKISKDYTDCKFIVPNHGNWGTTKDIVGEIPNSN